MITTPENVRQVRPVAENLNDPARLQTYIQEIEDTRLVDLIGARLYRWLDTYDFSGMGPYQYEREDGETITITRGDYLDLMTGGYFTDSCGCEHKNPGLTKGTAYLVYARMIINNPVNVTAFGVVNKNGNFSSNTSDNDMIRASNSAKNTGEDVLKKTVEHLKALNLLVCKQRYKRPLNKYVKVGRRML